MMPRTWNRVLGRTAAGAALVLVGAVLARADTIELVGGKKIEKVEIIQARWDQVQYKVGNKPAVSYPAAQVAAIERESTVLDRIRQVLEGGDAAKAQETFKAIPPNQGWVLAAGMYLLAKAEADAGKHKEAAAAFKAYLEKFKSEKEWYVPHATLGLAESLLAARQPGTAEIHFKELTEFGGAWAVRGLIGQADALIQSKGAGAAMQARGLYIEAARSSNATSDLRLKAALGRARVLLLQNQPQGVIAELDKEFFKSPKPDELQYTDVRAEASLLMGRAYMAQGGKENLEQAEIWLLRVPALYGKHAASYDSACDLLVDVYGKLGNKARADEWSARKGGATAKAGGGK